MVSSCDGIELPRSILLKGTSVEHGISLRIEEILDEVYRLAGGEENCQIDLKTGEIRFLRIHEDEDPNFVRRKQIEELEKELKILCTKKYQKSYE